MPTGLALNLTHTTSISLSLPLSESFGLQWLLVYFPKPTELTENVLLKERETLAQKWQQMLYRISPSYLNTFHCDRKA